MALEKKTRRSGRLTEILSSAAMPCAWCGFMSSGWNWTGKRVATTQRSNRIIALSTGLAKTRAEQHGARMQTLTAKDATRARDYLLVSGVDPVSEFLDDLMKGDQVLASHG